LKTECTPSVSPPDSGGEASSSPNLGEDRWGTCEKAIGLT